MLDSRLPLSSFPLLLVIDLAQEAIKKVSWDFLKALDKVLSDKGAVFKSKAKSVEFFFCRVDLHLAYTDYNSP